MGRTASRRQRRTRRPVRRNRSRNRRQSRTRRPVRRSRSRSRRRYGTTYYNYSKKKPKASKKKPQGVNLGLLTKIMVSVGLPMVIIQTILNKIQEEWERRHHERVGAAAGVEFMEQVQQLQQLQHVRQQQGQEEQHDADQ